ncbi:MAG: hypothetical protein ACWGMZ_05530, partial [Thermoguttaceae bacterium]
MAVQTDTTTNNFPFIRGGEPNSVDDAVFLTDAGRTTDIEYGTLVSKDPATLKYIPMAAGDLAATDGTEIPAGLVLETITAAALAAGDVTGVSVLVGGSTVYVDEDQIVLDDEGLPISSLDAEITNQNYTVRDGLHRLNIYP